MKKLIYLFIILFFLVGCKNDYLPNLYNYPPPDQQQVKIRKIIMNCQTFDCSVLNDEILILERLIQENNKFQGVQQSLVTTITLKCMNDNLLNEPCEKYVLERKKLKY
jgi:uncharacterized protein YcfL